jgi:hypothetical protein
MFSYETSLPELVGSIVAKFEPENKQQSILESPVFKKTRTVNRKVSSAKRKKTLEEVPSEDKKSKSNSIWERLSKRAVPLRKGSKTAKPVVAEKPKKSALTKSHSLTVRVIIYKFLSI